MSYRIISVILTLQLVSISFVKGQTCCSGGVPLSGNIGMPSAQQGTFQFSLNYDINSLKTLQFKSDKLVDSDRMRRTKSILFEAGYSFTDKFSIDLFFSHVNQERTIYNNSNRVSFTSTNGLGDAVILPKYRFNLNEYTWIMIGAGPKLPIGATDKVNESGILLGADLQPGSGAWDLISFGGFNHLLSSRPSMIISLNTTFRKTGINDSYLGSISYRFGSELQMLLSVGDRINLGRLIVDPTLSMRFRKALDDTSNDNLVPNSGGHWVFVEPALSLHVSRSTLINIFLNLPIYSFVEGTQLTPTLRLNAGIFYTVKRKTSVIDIEL